MNAFGEISEPVSRAAWEDWDDLRSTRDTSPLQWEQKSDTVEAIESLIILEGKYLTDCVQLQTQQELELINVIPGNNLQLFKSKKSNRYICTIKNFNLLLSSEIVELLKPYIVASQDVIGIQTKGLPEYQSTELMNQCIIRAVSTTLPVSKSLGLNFPKLEQPNIIAGVSAGVVCLREHLDKSAIAIVCYLENPEEYQTDEVEKLLKKIDMSPNTKSRPSSVLNSNLYM